VQIIIPDVVLFFVKIDMDMIATKRKLQQLVLSAKSFFSSLPS
jgi:hypothetical protein